jgi:hypothetical protein
MRGDFTIKPRALESAERTHIRIVGFLSGCGVHIRNLRLLRNVFFFESLNARYFRFFDSVICLLLFWSCTINSEFSIAFDSACLFLYIRYFPQTSVCNINVYFVFYNIFHYSRMEDDRLKQLYRDEKSESWWKNVLPAERLVSIELAGLIDFTFWLSFVIKSL